MLVSETSGFVTRNMLDDAVKARDAHLKALLSEGSLSVPEIAYNHGVSTDKVQSMRSQIERGSTSSTCVTQWDLNDFKLRMRTQMVDAIQQGVEVDKLVERHHVSKYVVYKLRSQIRLGLVDLSPSAVASTVSPPVQENPGLCPRCNFHLTERIDEIACMRCGYVWYPDSNPETAATSSSQGHTPGSDSDSFRRGCHIRNPTRQDARSVDCERADE